MSTSQCFANLSLAAIFSLTAVVRGGGIPEPDTVIYGETNGVPVSQIVAAAGGQTFAATSPEAGFYVVRIPTVNATSDLGDAVGAEIGGTVEIRSGGALVGSPVAVADRGQVTRVDITETGEDPIFRRGDVDGNGRLDVTDPINNLAFQFLGSFEPLCRDAMDFDDNGKIEVTDPIANLTHQFLGGPPPKAPGKQSCGVDPTADDLDCAVTAETCP